MPNHVKPTLEELKQQEQEIIADAEALKDAPAEEEKQEEQEEIEPSIPAVEEEQPEEPQEEAKAEEEVAPSEPEEEKLKKKLSASARENQKIYAKNRVINQALTEAEEIPEPTEDELKVEFKDWDVMTETEKVFAKEASITRRWRAKVSEAKQQATKIEKWNDSVDEFADDPKTFVTYPDLEGKADEFREFAKREESNSVPFSYLVGAFLHDRSTKTVKHKGQMFEKGSGGPNERQQPKGDKLTVEQGRQLRETDYNAWKQKLKEGKIESAV